MSTDLVIAPPTRKELEALPLADRIALEGAFGKAHDLIREVNDAEIAKLVSRPGGISGRALAAEMGVHHSTARRRLAELGLAAPVPRRPSEGVSPDTPLPQNGDGVVVDGEIVGEPRPEHYLPDVVDADADSNLRTQALHWFEQGRHLEELLNDDVVLESRSRDDKQAIQREAAEMVRIARRLKGATRIGRPAKQA